MGRRRAAQLVRNVLCRRGPSRRVAGWRRSGAVRACNYRVRQSGPSALARTRGEGLSVLRTAKKLVFGETWLLPLGVAAIFGASLLARRALGDHWHQIGGFVLLAGVCLLLVVSVSRSAKPR